MGKELTRLHQFIVDHYSTQELRALCFEIGVRYDDLGDGGITAKAWGLLLAVGEAKELERLLGQLKEERPIPFAATSFDEAVKTLAAELEAFVQSAKAEATIGKRELHNRQTMLRRVSDFWIKGILEDSLYNEVLINLGMEVKPDEVEYPWEMVLQRPEQAKLVLPPGTKILDVFDESGSSLLILGEPGSGKTTMLLELARQLILRAQSDFAQAIPVVFNLSSWAGERLSLDKWIEAELALRYDIPKRIARTWIANDALLLLLDGLDEVAVTHREECVETINGFRRERLVPLAICSRIADYEVLSTQLRVQSSILLQPLTPSQIGAYLERLGLERSGLYAEIDRNDQLQELARSPMMLSVMISTLQDDSPESLSASIEGGGSIEVYRKHLFDLYVKGMFGRRRPPSQFAPDQAIRWLSWLAQTMRRHDQTTFLAEDIQYTWLPTRKQQRSHMLIARGVGSLLFMLVGGLGFLLPLFMLSIVTPDLEFQTELVLFALVASLVGGISYILTSIPKRRIRGVIVIALTILTALLMLTALMIAGALAPEMLEFLVALVVAFLGIVLIFGVSAGVAGLKLARQHTIRFSASTRWSWRKALLGAVVGLLIGLVIAAVTPEDKYINAIQVGIPFGLLFALISGWESVVLSQSQVRSSGRIVRAAWQSLRMAGIAGLLIVITGIFIGILMGGKFEDMAFALAFALILVGPLGLAVGLAASDGTELLQHGVLRGVLYLHGLLPWALTDFLDYNVERAFLRQVGGGYVFIHQWLLEYFSALET